MSGKKTEKDLRQKKPREGSEDKKREGNPFDVNADEIRFVTHRKNKDE